MSDEEFREAVDKADGFVVSALRRGVVLIDGAFVQPFYLAPPSVKIMPQQARAEEPTSDRYREQVLVEIESDDLELARSALRRQAMHVGRLMLRAFGALPEDRKQLVETSRQYFGEGWAGTLSEAILDNTISKSEMIRLSRQISDQHDTFQSQSEHLEGFAALATVGGLTLESLCARAFEELLPGGKIIRQHSAGERDGGVDIRIEAPGATVYLIEIKSSPEHVPEASIESAVEILERAARSISGSAHLILVANSWVGKPPFEPVVDLYRGRATSHASDSRSKNLSVLSGLQVLCAHNRLHLEELVILRRYCTTSSRRVVNCRPALRPRHAAFSEPHSQVNDDVGRTQPDEDPKPLGLSALGLLRLRVGNHRRQPPERRVEALLRRGRRRSARSDGSASAPVAALAGVDVEELAGDDDDLLLRARRGRSPCRRRAAAAARRREPHT